jgi:hypothetical protein
VTPALIPGRQALILVNEEMLAVMKGGSVCVNLAAVNGGNVASAQPDQIITTPNGVKVIGYTNLPSLLASTASNLVGLFSSYFFWVGICLTLFSSVKSHRLPKNLPNLCSVLVPKPPRKMRYFKLIRVMMLFRTCSSRTMVKPDGPIRLHPSNPLLHPNPTRL